MLQGPASLKPVLANSTHTAPKPVLTELASRNTMGPTDRGPVSEGTRTKGQETCHPRRSPREVGPFAMERAHGAVGVTFSS